MRIVPALALLALAVPAEARLSRDEQAMAAAVDREADRHVALLERLVNRNSGTLNLEGVTAIGAMMRAELEPLGFAVRWIDMSETGRAGHILATHRGRGRNVLLIGHLDTVFEPDSPFQRFERAGSRATGPGIGDDKGGLVVIIAALRAMHQAGTLRDADVTIVLTGDEERPGAPAAIARRDLIAAGRAADYALEFETLARDGGQEFGTIARRSSTSWTLRATGRTGHSSGVFGEGLGYGAIYEMARILDSFRRELPEPNLTYNVGVVAGGTPATIDEAGFRAAASGKTNIVAETAIARGDIRTLSAEQEQRVRAAMQAIVAPASAAHRRRARLRRGRLSADGADRGQPRLARPPERRQPRPRPPRNGRIRPGPARRRRFGLRRGRRRHIGRPRRRRRQRPCDGRMGRSRHDPPPGQARRRSDHEADAGALNVIH